MRIFVELFNVIFLNIFSRLKMKRINEQKTLDEGLSVDRYLSKYANRFISVCNSFQTVRWRTFEKKTLKYY